MCGSLPIELVGGLDHLRHAGHAADEHQLIDRLSRSSFASFKQSLTGLTVRSKEVVGELLQLGASQLLLNMLRTGLRPP